MIGANRAVAGLAAMAVLALGLTADEVGAKTKNRRVGAYRGITEEGNPVSFRITRNRRVVDFIVPDARLVCHVEQQGTQSEPRYNKTVTIAPPAMPLQGVARFVFGIDNPDQFAPYQGIFVNGKPDTTMGINPTALKGNVVAYSWAAPTNVPGTEVCLTNYIDWKANKVGR
jgi:hypothetical protein